MKIELIQGLETIGAIKLQPNDQFTWTSGIKSPIYCDNRLTIGNVKLRKLIAKSMTEIVKENYPECQLIGACATAGIPHGTSIADQLDLPMIYFRSKPKEHGTNSVIEGYYQPKAKVVIVEDLISTGKSVVHAITAAQAAGLEVIGVVSIFTYDLNIARQQLSELGVSYKSLVTIDDLIKYSTQNFSQEDIQIIKTFIDSLNNR